MGWHINLERNTVKINSKIALELYNCEAQVCTAWEDECDFPMLDGIINNGKLVFNHDHMEHMDYIWEEEVQGVLKKNKVKGDICFSSSDGDDAGKRWGYRFDGNGGMTKLVGLADKWNEKIARKRAKKSPKNVTPLDGVKAAIEKEGFDYAFRNYSSFDEIKDEKFHALREAYVKAVQELESYVHYADAPWRD